MPDDATTLAAVSATTEAATGTGTTGQDWRLTLPEIIRNETTMEKFVTNGALDHGKLAESYVNLERMSSKKIEGMVKVPGADSTPEEKATYRTAQGVPADASGYTFDVPEPIRPYWSEDTSKAFAPVFHELGIPATTASKLATKSAEIMAAMATQRDVAYKEALNKHKEQVGAATFERQEVMVARMVEHIADTHGQEMGDKFAAIIGQTRLLDADPVMFRVLAKLGEDYAEQGHIAGTSTGTAGGSASGLIEKLKDPESAEWKVLMGPDGPAKEEMLDRRRKAYLSVYGSAAAPQR